MRSIGLPEIIVIVCVVASLAVPIWIARKAKPLGGLPYRWGTFVGLQTCILALSLGLALPDAIRNRAYDGIAVGGLTVLAASIGGSGVLLRKRWGVIALFSAWILLSMISPALDAIRGTHGVTPGAGFPVIVMLVASFPYFKKRWRVMGDQAALKT